MGENTPYVSVASDSQGFIEMSTSGCLLDSGEFPLTHQVGRDKEPRQENVGPSTTLAQEQTHFLLLHKGSLADEHFDSLWSEI